MLVCDSQKFPKGEQIKSYLLIPNRGSPAWEFRGNPVWYQSLVQTLIHIPVLFPFTSVPFLFTSDPWYLTGSISLPSESSNHHQKTKRILPWDGSFLSLLALRHVIIGVMIYRFIHTRFILWNGRVVNQVNTRLECQRSQVWMPKVPVPFPCYSDLCLKWRIRWDNQMVAPLAEGSSKSQTEFCWNIPSLDITRCIFNLYFYTSLSHFHY